MLFIYSSCLYSLRRKVSVLSHEIEGSRVTINFYFEIGIWASWKYFPSKSFYISFSKDRGRIFLNNESSPFGRKSQLLARASSKRACLDMLSCGIPRDETARFDMPKRVMPRRDMPCRQWTLALILIVRGI